MTQTSPSAPKTILLATDLGPRSDRALDRAFHLAEQWNAKLTLAHAIEFDIYDKRAPSWRQEPDRADILKRRLLDGFKLEGRPLPNIVIQEGRPDAVVLDLAKKTDAGLIVTGVAHAEPLGRGILGNSVTALLRKAACPVLTVKKRLPRGYRHIAIGIDLSDFSKKALEYTLANFPAVQKITLVHAVPVPFRGLVQHPGEYARKSCDEARAACESYLSGILPKSAKTNLVVDEGSPGGLLARYADDADVDLVVVGTHGENGLIETLLGTNASAILESVSCDVLVVR